MWISALKFLLPFPRLPLTKSHLPSQYIHKNQANNTHYNTIKNEPSIKKIKLKKNSRQFLDPKHTKAAIVQHSSSTPLSIAGN